MMSNKTLLCCCTALLAAFAWASPAEASRTITKVTLAGGSPWTPPSPSTNGGSVTALPGATINVCVTVELSSGDDWHSTGWRWGTSGTWNCANTYDWGSDTHEECFDIHAQGTPGTYTLQFQASGRNSNCTEETGPILQLTNAVIVSNTCPDDGNPCTNDVFVSNICKHTPKPNGTSCDDGQFCTTGETCQAGVCTGGSPKDCSSLNNACNIGVCNETTNACEAHPANEGGACDDGLFCTTGETCQVGVCTGGSPKDCSSLNNACNVGVCNETTNACEAHPANEGGACDDGLFCTTGETCTAGVCGGGSPTDCSALNNACNVGVCNETTNACEANPINEGDACDDGLFCTTGETCTAGVCGGGSPTDCSALNNACNIGVCNETTNACEANPINEGGSCSDGVWCNGAETCQAGVCTDGADPCVDLAHCDETHHACYACVDNSECNDSDPCTLDACVAGACSNLFQDADGDGVCDANDNAPNNFNPDQADTDADGIPDVIDNCPAVANPDQADANGNGVGDACEAEPAPEPTTPDEPETQPLPSCCPESWCGVTGTATILLMLSGIGVMKGKRRRSR